MCNWFVFASLASFHLDLVFLLSCLICEYLEHSDENLITGTIPTEFGNLQSLLSLSAGKIISGLNKDCSQQYLFYPSNNISLWSDALLFIVIHKVGNRLTGSVPSELGTISTLSNLNLGKLCSCVKCAMNVLYDRKLKDICFLALFSP